MFQLIFHLPRVVFIFIVRAFGNEALVTGLTLSV